MDHNSMKFVFVSILITQCCLTVHCASYEDAQAIFKNVTSTYTKEMRPLLDQSLPVYVNVYPTLRSVNSYDEVSGTLSLMLVLTVTWMDEKLTWNPAQVNGISSMILPQTLVWKPELFLINPAEVLEPIGNEAFKVRIQSNGIATWYTGGEIKTSCSPDMTYFPFDIQICNLIFAPWGYIKEEVEFYATTTNVDISNATDNGAWSLLEATYKTYYSYGVSMVELTFKLERKSLYFLLTLIFPVLSLCVMNPMVFTLPHECGERISFCITILLSFAVFMTLTGETIPKVSEPMPRISIYLFIIQSFSGCITTMNGFILRLYNRKDKEPVPPLLWKVICLCNIVLNCGCCQSKVRPETKKTTVRPLDDTNCEKKNIDCVIIEDIKDNYEPFMVVKETDSLDSTSWETVGKTLDRVCFLVSYFLLSVVSVIFLMLIGIRA